MVWLLNVVLGNVIEKRNISELQFGQRYGSIPKEASILCLKCVGCFSGFGVMDEGGK